jgi:hypothetical protein
LQGKRDIDFSLRGFLRIAAALDADDGNGFDLGTKFDDEVRIDWGDAEGAAQMEDGE